MQRCWPIAIEAPSQLMVAATLLSQPVMAYRRRSQERRWTQRSIALMRLCTRLADMPLSLTEKLLSPNFLGNLNA